MTCIIQPAFEALYHETHADDVRDLQRLVRRCAAAEVVEIGSWVGRTALAMLEAGAARVFCIDTFGGNRADRTGALAASLGQQAVFRTFCRNADKLLFRKLFPCVGQSTDWARVWPFPVYLVFIDGDHDYEAVKADILAWKPHVKKGGILCGHDYGVEGLPGVKRAVDELVPAQRLRLAGQSLWWTVMI